ncbi:MAG: SDR family NAD(P)-dependent oxidoreductase [Clostridium sp.]
MKDKRKWVLITGASSGIGLELSKIFAKNNYNLILIARNIEALSKIKDELLEKYGTYSIVISKDLSESNSVEEIFSELIKLNIKVHILINNAGIGDCGLFHKINIENHNSVIKTNMIALTELTHFSVNDMIEQGEGKILNVVSTGAYQPGPYTAVYYASKAYVLSLTEALSIELKHYNIQVSGLCPGTTKTNFHNRAGKGEIKGAMEPELVAEIGYKQFMKGKNIIIPGVKNKIAIGMSKVFPRKLLGKIVEYIQKSAISIKK